MADFTSSPMAGGYSDDSNSEFTVADGPNRLTTVTNMAGAAVSLVLIIGIGIWGYKLLVRDVSGIPVVRAVSGDMRIRPDDPGGELASHQGLSVNEVAAIGTAAALADRLILAPKPIELADEDEVMPAAMVASAQQEQKVAILAETAILNAEEVSAALASGNVDDIVAQLTAGVAPLSDLEEATEAVVASLNQAVLAKVSPAEQQVALVLDAPGVRRSIRPKKRPATRNVVTPAALIAASTSATGTQEASAASLPAGTRLAQLGAFDSPEVAREQWDQLSIRFDTYLADKTRIVQKATSGGRVFYRLRAKGFEDIADARRFCSALVAQNADCIPVVTR